MSTRRQPPAVACISLEAWDTTWRRNQHLASRLVEQGHASGVVFVEPPALGKWRRSGAPAPGVTTLRPALPWPKRAGGLRLTGSLLRGVLRKVDALWVNDPQLGVHCLRAGLPVVYDVTDDWRTFPQPDRIVRRIVDAEDVLARRARTVVCSDVLAARWRERYGVTADVVHNGVDHAAFAQAEPALPSGQGPHLGYIGTLHPARLDVALVLALAEATTGTVHLVGPDALDDRSRAVLQSHPRITLSGPVPAREVPAAMRGMDVLLCPHVVDDFTLSLDAIKSYEYLAAGRPVVATPTSGFQSLVSPGLRVIDRTAFVSTALSMVGSTATPTSVAGWDERAEQFAAVLLAA